MKKHPNRKHTLESCKLDALKYKTRGEWNENNPSYQSACTNGWLEECCGHMVAVYQYHTLESCKLDALKYKTRDGWKKNNPSVYKSARINGWTEECCEHMVAVYQYHTLESCKLDALKYKTKSEWRKNNTFIYRAAYRNGWTEECCEHMELPFKHTLESCKIDALKYKTKSEWRKNSVPIYCIANKNRWTKECCEHMEPPSRHTLESCKLDALKYKTKNEWDKNSPLCQAARKNGWLEECCDHMIAAYQYHTLESCKLDALKYQTRGEWKENSPAYQAARVRDWLEECCGHMPSFSCNSTPEQEVADFIPLLNTEVVRGSRKIIAPLELDIYVPSHSLAIEFNGLYWHSDLCKDNDYHFNKRKMCEEKNITLIQINNDEWETKKEIIKSIILAKLGLIKTKYYARKLTIKIVSSQDSQLFLEENHLMGKFTSAKHIGLYDGDELISLISYKKYKDGIDISRFCNKINTSVAGGLSKLLKYIEKTEKPAFIQSFVDLRYGTGDSLLSLGYELKGISLGWKWTDFKQTFNRLKCRANMDERKLSEKEHAKELKLYKIYDAGQAKFIKTLTSI